MNSQDISEVVITPGRQGDAKGDARAREARRGLLAYFAILLPLSVVLQGLAIMTGQFMTFVLMLMLVPAFASIIVRLVQHEGFSDVSFRIGGRGTWWAMLIGWLGPIGVGLVAYGVAWLTGLATFAPSTSTGGDDRIAAFALTLLSAVTFGTITTLIFSAGEEIGWRGYMLTRLIDGRIPYPILASGLIWGLWHTPLILAGQYAAGANPLLSVPIFLVSIASAGFLFAWARLATGSIWPAVVMHAAWNATIQGAFDRSTTGENALLWTGESGILVAATLLVLAVVSTRVRYTMLRAVPPRQEPAFAEPDTSSKAA